MTLPWRVRRVARFAHGAYVLQSTATAAPDDALPAATPLPRTAYANAPLALLACRLGDGAAGWRLQLLPHLTDVSSTTVVGATAITVICNNMLRGKRR